MDGCKKYPEDNLPFHLSSAEKRLTKSEWTVKTWTPIYTTTFFPDCSSGSDMVCSFSRSGSCDGGCNRISHPGATTSIPSDNYDFSGSWEFANGEKDLVIKHSNGNSTTWLIKELDRTEMKIISDSTVLYLTR
jgi:hypothetical protein